MQKCHLTKTQHLFITLKKLSEVEIEKNLVKNIYEKHIANVILNSKTEKELLPGSGIRQIISPDISAFPHCTRSPN
jgi:hypothetical protein